MIKGQIRAFYLRIWIALITTVAAPLTLNWVELRGLRADVALVMKQMEQIALLEQDHNITIASLSKRVGHLEVLK